VKKLEPFLNNKNLKVIFMDCNMPEVDGIDATRMILEKYNQ
jgi:CheY-like chemotaxis protein